MKVIATPLAGVLVLEPKVFGDARGFFTESYNARQFAEATGFSPEFVQDNHSRSGKGVLRGLHYQIQHAQDKLVRVAEGAVYDVVVDLRRSSTTFGQSFGVLLDSVAHRQLWVPKGFAHGFVALTERVDFLYKTTDYWFPEHERALLWNDPALNIHWPLAQHGITAPLLNGKDAAAKTLAEVEVFA